MLRRLIHTMNVDLLVFFLSLVNSIVINRALGPALLGQYILVTTAAILLSKLVSLGIESSVSTLAAKDRSLAGSLYMQSVLSALILGGGAVSAFFLAYGYVAGSLLKDIRSELILPALLTVPLLLHSSYWSSLMAGLEEITLLNRYKLVSSLSMLLIAYLVLMVFKSGLVQLLYLSLAFNSLLALLAGCIVFRRYRGSGVALRRGIFQEALSLGVKAHLGNIAHFVFHRVDYFLINYLIGSQAVGFYGLATSLAESIWMTIGSLYTVTLARIAGSPLRESVDLVAKILRNVVFLLCVVAAALMLCGYGLIKILYGAAFLPAYVPMILLLPGVIFFGASWFLGLFFIGHQKRPGVTTAIAWAGLALSLPLYVLLIKFVGISGAAIASSATYLFIFLATFLLFRKVSGKSLSEVLFIRKADIGEVYVGLRRMVFPAATSEEGGVAGDERII